MPASFRGLSLTRKGQRIQEATPELRMTEIFVLRRNGKSRPSFPTGFEIEHVELFSPWDPALVRDCLFQPSNYRNILAPTSRRLPIVARSEVAYQNFRS
jgi:hypothetical protein